ncbi:MAG: hypothetical protein GWP10_02680 [Nitrospiraceae bacterium]|nr:hypothetical protein [Nitrospiraceae bacterium]
MDIKSLVNEVWFFFRKETRYVIRALSFYIAVIIISSLLVFDAFNCPSAYGVIVDRIAAVVNGDVITLSELENTARPIFQKYIDADMSKEEIKAKKQEILHRLLPQLIDERLVEKEIKKLNISVNKQEIEDALDRICKENYMSRDEFVAQLESKGETLKGYKKEIKRQIERATLINRQVSSKIVITDEQVKIYIKSHQPKQNYNGQLYILQHISVVPKDPNNPDLKKKARERAEEAYRALKKGESFKEVVKRYSDFSPDEKDGYLGSFTLREMAPFVRQAVIGLKPGDFSKVVDSPMGWQIFRLKEIARGGKGDNGRSHIEKIRQKLYRKEINARFEEWLNRLRSKSTIRILL